MKKLFLIIVLSFTIVSSTVSAHPAFNNKKAGEYLQAGKLEAAEKELHLAQFDDPERAEIKYNLGFLSYRKRNYKKAARYFVDAAENSENKELQFNSLHNLGNSFYRQGNYAKAVEAYKKGLEIEQNAKTSFNLKKAEEMLKKQIEQQQKQQQNKEQKKQNSKQNQQNQQQQNGNKQQQQDSKNGSKQDQGKQNSEQNADKSDKNQQNKQQGNKQSEQQKQNQQGQTGQDQQQQMADKNKQKRQDVQMGKQNGEEKKKPQASQRARALKNRKLNPYMVEKLLRELKEREKKGQLYYRNEPQRQEELDPFSMNAHQLRDFFRNRGRGGRNKPKSDEPDW